MKHEPIHPAPANDDVPTTRLRRISEIDGVDPDETLDGASAPRLEGTPVISLDESASYAVGFNQND